MRSPLRGSGQLFSTQPQGSQSLALGLALAAASQLRTPRLVGESQNCRADPSLLFRTNFQFAFFDLQFAMLITPSPSVLLTRRP
jgi:hypothetical protein